MKILLTVLTVIGIVFASLIVILLLLLAVKIKVQIGYKDTLILNLKILFLNIKILPKKNKDKKEKQKEAQEKKEQEDKTKPDKKNIIKEKISRLKLENYLELADIIIHKFIAKIFFEKLHVNIVVASDDAAKTALTYGKINSVLYPLAGFIDSRKKVDDMKISVIPDFSAEKPHYEGEAVIYIRIWHAIVALIDIIKYILKGV